jgi:hypothetical protein
VNGWQFFSRPWNETDGLQVPYCILRLGALYPVHACHTLVFFHLHCDKSKKSNRAIEMNPLVQSGELTKGCFVKLGQYQASMVKGKMYVVYHALGKRKFID